MASHLFLIGYGILSHVPQIGAVTSKIRGDFRAGLATLGAGGMILLFLKAFSMGGGTYTGIEAVSNGLQILREPRAQTGKKTMVYMAASLAFTAGGILMLISGPIGVAPAAGKTLNAVLAEGVFGRWKIGGALALITIFSEGALLLVAAQTGFIDAPRVMANMAIDSWLPHRFGSLSDRLTMRNGVLMIGVAAFLVLIYTHGSISALVVMYSINVFLTFSLSEFGMAYFFWKNRRKQAKWKQQLCIQLTGLALCLTILTITVAEKFREGGWLTFVITAVVIGLCLLTKAHYNKVRGGVRELDELLDIPIDGKLNNAPFDAKAMTAIQLVNGYNGFGVHNFVTVIRSFPGLYKNFVFVSVAEVDVGSFRDSNAVSSLEGSVCEGLKERCRPGPPVRIPGRFPLRSGYGHRRDRFAARRKRRPE